MLETLISLLFVYVFIILGYMGKRFFQEDMHEKTLTILSVYFLQPFITVWGLSTAKLYSEHILVPLLYLGIIFILSVPAIILSKLIFLNNKEQAIFSITGFIGNTGNIGIPLGLALFGEESVIYTTLITIANVFVIYVIGVYIYSRGSFSIRESLLNIMKIPIIPAAIFGILLNVYDVSLNDNVRKFFIMGAYAGIVMQLFIMGTYLHDLKLHDVNIKLYIGTLSQKFVLLPLISIFILSLTNLSSFVQAVILMQMMTPLAIANVMLSSIYDCKPKVVTTLVLVSTLLFIPIIFLLNYLINMYYI